MRARRWRRRVARRRESEETSEETCDDSGSDADIKVGLTQRDRVCQELRDLQVFF